MAGGGFFAFEDGEENADCMGGGGLALAFYQVRTGEDVGGRQGK